MKKYLVLGSIVFGLTPFIHGQNIGVNVPNPQRAKFEVNGVAGSTPRGFRNNAKRD